MTTPDCGGPLATVQIIWAGTAAVKRIVQIVQSFSIIDAKSALLLACSAMSTANDAHLKARLLVALRAA
jgi:hypothetical protein